MSIDPVSSSIASNLGRDLTPQSAKVQSESSAVGSSRLGANLKKIEKHSDSSNFLKEFKDRVTGSPVKPKLEEMKQRLSDIERKGKTLLHHPYTSIVSDYVSSIKGFLSDVGDHAYESQSEGEIFEKTKVVDQKLNKLADDFMAGQTRELDLINSLGELQGLLVDLFV